MDDQFGLDFDKMRSLPSPRLKGNFGESRFARDLREHLFSAALLVRQLSVFTGFASLSTILRELSELGNKTDKIRLLIGSEENINLHFNPGTRSNSRFGKALREYWQKRGLSITQYLPLVRVLELIDREGVEVRVAHGFHGKYYGCENGCFIGSSNFSQSGLYLQKELNYFIPNTEQGFDLILDSADRIWEEAKTFTQEFRDLLDGLLQATTWQEALSWVYLQITEGMWLDKHPELLHEIQLEKLWPNQKASLSQGLYILGLHDCLLLADATGSGKTRTVAALHTLLVKQKWLRGRGHRSAAMILSPPAGMDNWHREFQAVTRDEVPVVSHGSLSVTKDENKRFRQDGILGRLQQKNILYVDEGHNFYRRTSNRTRLLRRNRAENIAVITATPINKELGDLMPLVQLLDIDNFPQKTHKMFFEFFRDHSKMRRENLRELARTISQITVRHTKIAIKEMIAQSPQDFHDDSGNPCQFPKVENLIIPISASQQNKALVQEIRTLAKGLKGLVYLRGFEKIEKEAQRIGKSEAKVFHTRLNAARGLIQYQITAGLQSSKYRLLEHCGGSELARKVAKNDGLILDGRHNNQGSLERLAGSSFPHPPPEKSWDPPSWLMNPEGYTRALEEEIQIYKELIQLASALDLSREEAKAKAVIDQAREGHNILAFDHYIISLQALEQILKRRFSGKLLFVKSTKLGKAQAERTFHRTSVERGIIGLCSDSVSESINLQGASRLFHLTIPSVLRETEQRIGRIDRLNSPYQEIKILWPQDEPEYRLRTTRRLFEAYKISDALFGKNFVIPDELLESSQKDSDEELILDAQEVIHLYQARQEDLNQSMDEITDAFGPWQRLAQTCIDPAYLKLMREHPPSGRLLSVLSSPEPFVFLLIRRHQEEAPKPVLVLTGSQFQLISDWSEIEDFFKEHFSSFKEDIGPDGEFTNSLEKVCMWLSRNEKLLLSNREQTLLRLWESLFSAFWKNLDDHELRDDLQQLHESVTQREGALPIDLSHFLATWNEWLQPHIDRFHEKHPRALFTLKLLAKPLLTHRLTGEDIRSFQSARFSAPPLEDQIEVAMVGLKKTNFE